MVWLKGIPPNKNSIFFSTSDLKRIAQSVEMFSYITLYCLNTI